MKRIKHTTERTPNTHYPLTRHTNQRLHSKITSEIEEVVLNGHPEQRLPGNLNLSFSFVEGEGLMMAIKDVAVSSGSACTSASLEPSYVLRSMGLDEDLAHSSIRFGLGRFTTEEEVDYVADLVVSKVKRLRLISRGCSLMDDAQHWQHAKARDVERNSHGIQRKSD